MADRISDLPDAIICHILSFLPTQQTVATSVLSKRWKSLWCLVPTLDFNYAINPKSKETYRRFVQSVSAVLLLRDWHQPIQKFRLRCDRFCNPADARTWIHAALQRRVEHLDFSLSLHSHYPSQIPIINCSTLVVLKLGKDFVLKLPSSPYFPSLKILHMKHVRIADLSCLSKFLSGCPILEDLKTTRLYLGRDSVEEFEILPKLVRAFISKYDVFLLKAVSNAKFLHLTQMDDALNGDESETDEPEPHESDTDDEDTDVNENSKQSFGNFVPLFHNLTHVELNYMARNTDWIEVAEILQSCPKLQVIVINKGIRYSKVQHWSKPQSIPKCISLHLMTCCLTACLDGRFMP